MEVTVFEKKAYSPDKHQLQLVLEDVSYSCGAMFNELDIPDSLTCVHVLEHICYDPVEPLYYVAGFDPICVYCASEELRESSTEYYYPMCNNCFQNKEPIKKQI